MPPSPPETRASLILRLPNAADVAAWEEFVAIYRPLVHGLAIRRGLQPTDADDLVQEVFAAVARQVGDWLNRRDRLPFRAETTFGILRRITDTDPRPICEINPAIPLDETWIPLRTGKVWMGISAR